MRERGRRDQGGVLNADAMVYFVTLLETTQDGDGGFDGRLGYEHGLEPAFEGRVFLYVLAVFIERGGADAAEFAARELRLHDVDRITGSFGGTGTDERVQFINEQYDFTLAGGDFLEERLEPFFEFAPILGPGNHRAQIHGHEPFIFQGFGHITAHNAPGQTFGNGGLAHARFADEHGIVFRSTREHLHDAADFLVATDHGINLPLPGQGGEVTAVFFKGLEFPFRLLIGHPLVATQIGEGFQHRVPLEIVGRKNLFQRRAGGIQQSKQQMLGAHIIIFELGGLGLRGFEGFRQILARIRFGSALNLVTAGEFLFQIGLQAVGRHADFLEQFGHQAFGLADKREQQMFAIQFLVRMFPGQTLRVLQGLR